MQTKTIRGASRRSVLLAFTALSIAGAGMSACANVETVTQKVVADIQVLNTAVQNQSAAISTALHANPTTLATVTNYIGQIATLAGQISTSVAVNVAQPIATQIGTDLGDVVTLVQNSGITLPSSVSLVLQAAQVLLPVILAGLGLVGAAPPAGNTMTEDMARAVLTSAAHHS